MKLDDHYWSNRYLEHTATWDAGGVTTPLKEYIDQLYHKDIELLIPGCGNSYEAEYLLQNGFTNITLIDISTVLCRQLEEKFSASLSKGLTIVCGDFFDHVGQYDLVLEQTFFCALDPSLRNSYMSKMFTLLKPGGKLVGLFFNRAFEGGPPFGGDKDEYKSLFQKKFAIEIMDECYNSIPARNGAELFIKLVKKQ